MKTCENNAITRLLLSCIIIFISITTFVKAQPATKFTYNGYSWGMSKDQVLKATHYRVISTKEDELYFMALDKSISNADQVSMTFNFEDERLKEISFVKTFVDDDDKAEDQYKTEKSDLTSLFGNPVKETPSYNKKFENDVYWMYDSTEITLNRFSEDAVYIKFTNLKKNAGLQGNNQIAAAKPVVVFSDSFNDNSNQWGVGQGQNYNASIENGVFKIEILNTGGRYFSKPVKIDSSKDFSIECKTTWLDGINDNGYGILWSHQSWDDSKCFKITANQYYRIWDSKDGDNGVTNWIKSNSINAKGENTLKIARKGEILEYYINGELVHTSAFRGFRGNLFGFIVNDKQTVAFDDFKIVTKGDATAPKKLKPNFGNLTVYTNNNKNRVFAIHIQPVFSLDELSGQLDDISNLVPARFGMNTGHYAKLAGTLNFVNSSLPVNDFYDGTNGNEDKPISPNLVDGEKGLAVGPFAGTNWNNNQSKDGDYYYSINLPYGKYRVTFSSDDNYENNSSIFGDQEIIIDKSSTILPVTIN